MMRRVAADEEVENPRDFEAETGLNEKEPHMKSDPEVEVSRPSQDQTNQQKKTENEAEGLGSTSSSELQETMQLSPSFRSAAAMAGWDAETLLMAALSQSPINSRDGHNIPAITQDASEDIQIHARKRDKHTPLSSARRHRRVRWEGSNGSPLGRLPMKPLTLLSDNDLENNTTRENLGTSSGAVGKENGHPKPSTCKKETDLKAKKKERTPTKPPCLDQLREELSCAVCLDICFEPSTISCGHSFCGTCLQSVLQKCGPRCPKCRQPVRSEALRNCRVNTVLWNTIQILFPKESAARIQDQQRQCDEETAQRVFKDKEHRHSRRTLGTRPARMQPWRSSAFFNNVSQISVMGNLRSSFQAASELMMPNSRHVEGESPSQQFHPPTWISRENRQRQGSSRRHHAERLPRLQSGRQVPATQEQVDAALAARLQQAELNPGSDVEALLIVEGFREATHQIPSHPSSPT